MKQFNLSEWAIKNQAMVLYFLFALLLAGAFSYTQLPQKEDPEFTFKVMTIKATWPGASAGEMERLVTDRMERALQETPWLENIDSYSKPGESEVFITLKESMPPSELQPTWLTVRKKLADARVWLPEGVQGPVINDEFGDTFGSVFALTSDQKNNAELLKLANSVRRELLDIPNISKITPIGIQQEKIYIEFSSEQIARYGIDPLKVAAILKAQNEMEPAGEIISDEEITRVRVSGDFHSLENIQNIDIPLQGKNYRLGDISYVYRGFEDPPRFQMRHQGKEAIGLAILMNADGDAHVFGENLRRKIDKIRSQLPPDVQLHQVADQPQVVKTSIQQFMRALTEALVIVLAVSFLSLGWRAGVVVALSIPVVMAGTFLLMHLLGIDLHRVSIGALIIAIGLLVDDAMIAVEMMKVKLEQGWSRASAAVFAYKSTAFPMLTGTLITAAAFLPVGLAKSAAGEYTFSICAVVTLSLLVSWLVAVVFTPFLGYRLMQEHPQQALPQYQTRFALLIRRGVTGSLRHRKAVILATVAAFALALAGFGKIEQQFFPPSERPELLMEVWLPESAPFASTEEVVSEIEKTLLSDKNVAHFTSYIGGSTPRFYLPLDLQLPSVNYAQVVITAQDMAAREALLKRIRGDIDKDYPDAGVRIARLENGPPVGYPVQFRVMGEDLAQVKKIAADVLQVVKQNGSVRNVSQDSNEPIKTVKVEVDQDKARALGISSRGLARYLQTLLSGNTVSYYLDGGKRLGIVIRASEGDRKSLQFMNQIKVVGANGQLVPLSAFARIVPATEPGIVWHRNRQPVVTVRADVPDTVQAPDVGAAIDQQLTALRASLPSGYRIEAGGTMENSDKATDSILSVLPLMAFIILTLLMFQLRHFSLVALVLLTAPLGIIGVVAALLLFQVPFGFVAMLGMISLAGMIMRNSVILVDQIEQDMTQGLSRYEAIIDSTVRRARPILLTAAAAILAMIPLAGSVFWGPMALVIMGGLLVATLLTLIFLPALYAFWFAVKAP